MKRLRLYQQDLFGGEKSTELLEYEEKKRRKLQNQKGLDGLPLFDKSVYATEPKQESVF
jgi:hypothetical protein